MSATLVMPWQSAMDTVRSSSHVSPEEIALKRLNEQTRTLLEMVASHWDELTADQKEVFHALACELLPGKTKMKFSWSLLWFAVTILFSKPSHREMLFLTCASVIKLRDRILDRVERENKQLQACIAERLSEATGENESGFLEAKDFSEWAKTI